MGSAAPDIPDGMRGIHRRFSRWRKSHTGRLPIPEPLWSAAAEVAREHGVFRTAKVLSLEYGKLKRLAKESRPGGRRTARLDGPPAAFMELLTPGTGSRAGSPPGVARTTSGVPFKRLERLEGNLGIPLPAATQWGVAEKATLGLRPAYDEFIRQAALGEVMHNDDTGMRILRLAREPADPRTGIFTSGIVSLGPGWKIALYFSGAKHAGRIWQRY